jgi:hypothetical protein
MTKKCQHVIIAGGARCGTSITGELVSAMGYELLFEPGMPLVDTTAPPTVLKLPRTPDPSPGLMFNIDAVESRLPDAKYIWMVRNPLDNVCSLFMGMQKNMWRHPPYPEHLERWVERPVLEKAIHYWHLVHTIGWPTLDKAIGRDRVYVVRFEELVLNVQNTARKIAGFLQSSNDGRQFWHNISNDTASYHAALQDKWDNNSTGQRVGRYKKELSKIQIKMVRDTLYPKAKRYFNYTEQELGGL